MGRFKWNWQSKEASKKGLFEASLNFLWIKINPRTIQSIPALYSQSPHYGTQIFVDGKRL